MDLRLLEPTAMVAGGVAMARDVDGRVVFVDGALPGERVQARLIDERSDFARAVAVEILDASPDRVEPPCPAVAAGCGGCTWQHVAAEAQSRLKADIVIDALRRIGKPLEPPTPEVFPLEGASLRTTARLAVSETGRAGYRPRRGSGAVESDKCQASHPRLEELILDGRYPGAGEVFLRVSVATGQRLVRVDHLAKAVSVPSDVLVIQDGDGSTGTVDEVVSGRSFRVSADSFFQPGPVAAGGLVAAVAAAAGDALVAGGLMVDAYAGVGLFGSILGAESGMRVVAVESHPVAAADARVNLADIDARVTATEVARWRLRRDDPVADLVVADPSRPGLGRPGVAALTATGAARIVLVSCDPASLARDASLLALAGFRLVSVSLIDAFPDTFHVETVSRFDRVAG